MTLKFCRTALAALTIWSVASATTAMTTETSVRMTESDGMVIALEHDASSILVSNPDIANVQPLSDSSFFLFAKQVGNTTLFVLNEENEIIYERRVVVTRSLQNLTRVEVTN